MKTAPIRLHLPVSVLELLEPRIAPAGIASAEWVLATEAGGAFALSAGQGLATSSGGGGAKMLYVEAGQALVFSTDLNGNNLVDTNEITGIAASHGLRLVSFVDINGDIVTNLNSDGRTLTDSDGNPANGLDGRVVLNNRIDSIVLRSLVAGEVTDPFASLAKSNYSIFGNIYAGGGLGSTSTQGLLIDTSGFALQEKFGRLTLDDGVAPVPMVGYIFTGSAVSGQSFSFGTAPAYGNGAGESIRGTLAEFTPAAGQAAGDITGVRSVGDGGAPVPYLLGGIVTGDGGAGARGGDIINVFSTGDLGGLLLRTGSGGDGDSGGRGGDITGLSVTESVNSRVEIITGDGGFGLLGAAGRAGNVLFNGEISAYGNILVGLGDGGGAVGNAGAGTSLTNGTFTNPGVGLQTPAEVVTTWRQPGDIGNYAFDAGSGQYVSRQFDFDQDGFNDAVYISNNSNQIVVLFGTAGGLEFRTGQSQLDAPIYAPLTARSSALVVAEIGGPLGAGSNPLPDIVTASSSGTSGVGLVSFVNRGFDNSGVWLGFAVPRYSPLPGAGIEGVSPIDISRTSLAAVTALAPGDFTRDGIVDIALIETRDVNTTAPTARYIANLVVMSGLAGADGLADGYFAADFNKGSGTVRNSAPAVNVEPGRTTEAFAYQLKASAAERGDADSDVLAYIDRTDPIGDPPRPGNTRFHPLQMVDTASGQVLLRLAGAGGTPFLYSERVVGAVDGVEEWVGYGASQAVSVYNFEFLDADNDGFFDAVGIGNVRPNEGSDSEPYLAAAVLQGGINPLDPALFEIVQRRQIDEVNFPDDPQLYFGIALTEKTNEPDIPSVLGENWADVEHLGMATGSYDASPGGTNIVLNVVRGGGVVALSFAASVAQYPVAGPPPIPGFVTTVPPVGRNDFSAIGTADLTQTSLFEPWQPVAGVSPADMVNIGFVDRTSFVDPFRWALLTPVAALPISLSSLDLEAGNGGNSSLGRGGDGGALGGATLIVDTASGASGSLTINGYGSVKLQSGSGGSGYMAGGRGGILSGIAVQAIELFGTSGSGGSAMAGNGGAGGAISQFFFQGVAPTLPLVELTAGAGGFGLVGGAGGSVLGGSNPLSADVQVVAAVKVTAGDGGLGITRGGAGGSITNFTSDLYASGLLELRAGHGASAVSGVGGAGGSVLSSAPVPQTSIVTRPMLVEAGNAGAGLTGGVGGSVNNFVFLPDTPPTNPLTVRIVAGDGGSGVTGNGGAGGELKSVTVSGQSVGLISLYLAGAGGGSSGASGGAGGTISSLEGGAVAGAAMAVAGAGGNGLTIGGAGGAIRQANLSVGGNDVSRAVFMAGQGGSAYGVSERQITAENTAPLALADLPRMFALGSVNGRAGAGGDLADLRQRGATAAASDLIAGNGGSLISYGTGSDTRIAVGRGGSVTNVILTGSAGIIDEDALIASYAFNFAQLLRDRAITSTDDPSVGNVGVLVGSKGFARNDRAVTGGVTGSVSNFSASNIMSMVAGSVDRVAKITAIDNLQVTSGNSAVLGDAKNDPRAPIGPPNAAPYRDPSTTSAYLKPSGLVNPTLQGGGKLIDGAIFTSRYTGQLDSLRFFKG